MKVAMIGTGYVGLVSGACLADFGHTVTCVDKDHAKVASLRNGIMPIYEPGLAQLVETNVHNGRLAFETDIDGRMGDVDAVFIAVGTPSKKGQDGYADRGHAADLSYVHAAAREVAGHLDGYTVVVTKSTVPVGTGDDVERIVREALRPGAEVDVVSNPEFLREGAAITDFKHPDRIVIGTDAARAREAMTELYRPLYLNRAPILFTSRRTSELIKYAANAFLATKVGFINEIADLCELVGADVQEVARGIGLDNRIGFKFLHAGPGYGGSCFPKDTMALIEAARSRGNPLGIIEAVAGANAARKRAMAGRIATACGGSVAGRTIALLGLAFKPNTDDMREAPALDIISALQAEGARVRAFDPQAMEQAGTLLDGVDFARDAYDCASGAHALVIVTEWDEFRALDLARVRSSLQEPAVVVDLRNIYRPEDMARRGFQYTSVGRPTLSPASGGEVTDIAAGAGAAASRSPVGGRAT